MGHIIQVDIRPICQALRKSCSGVTLDENITSLPVIPAASDKSSSE